MRKIAVGLITVLFCIGAFTLTISAEIWHVEEFEGDELSDFWEFSEGHAPSGRKDEVMVKDGQFVMPGYPQEHFTDILWTTEVYEDNYAFRIHFEIDCVEDLEAVVNRIWITWDGGGSETIGDQILRLMLTPGLSEQREFLSGGIRVMHAYDGEFTESTFVEYDFVPGETAVFDVIVAVQNGGEHVVIVRDGEGDIAFHEEFSDYVFPLGSGRIGFWAWFIRADVRINTFIIGETLEDVQGYEL